MINTYICIAHFCSMYRCRGNGPKEDTRFQNDGKHSLQFGLSTVLRKSEYNKGNPMVSKDH